MIVAGAIIPLLAMIGGGIDMGRSYLTESRLQAACDAGVLAARKKLGSSVAAGGIIPADVGTTGQSFFNINFPDGLYGTQNRSFMPTLEADYAISGVATAEVPTTIMRIFAFDKIPVRVECEAKLNFSNTDLMMVLDTTGSMQAKTVLNGVTMTRMAALKTGRARFLSADGCLAHRRAPASAMASCPIPTTSMSARCCRMAGSRQPGIISRASGWRPIGPTPALDIWTENHRYPRRRSSGPMPGDVNISRYAATWNPPTTETGLGYYSCSTARPGRQRLQFRTLEVVAARTEDPAGSGSFVTTYKWVRNTVEYWQTVSRNRLRHLHATPTTITTRLYDRIERALYPVLSGL